MKTKSFEDMGEEEFGYLHGVDGFGTRNDNYPLCKAMVDHNHDRVLAMDFREIGNLVDQNLFKGEWQGGGDWIQWGSDRMSIRLVLLTGSTAFNEPIDVCRQSRPPKVPFQERLNAEPSRMSQGR